MPLSSSVTGVQVSGNVWQKQLQMIFSCGHVSEVIRNGSRIKLIKVLISLVLLSLQLMLLGSVKLCYFCLDLIYSEIHYLFKNIHTLT